MKGQLSLCSFVIKCQCDPLVDVLYADQVIAHQLVNGLEDGTILEKVIAHFDETTEQGLVEIQKCVDALELGKWNQSCW